jgi:protein O-mannosyl-transferase
MVAIVAAGAFARAPLNGYAVDDPGILNNPLLHSVHSLPAVLTSAWWWMSGDLYRPLTLFSLAVDQLVGGGAPWLPHTINVVLHALVAVLVTRLYARFVPLRAAVAGGLLFALLPVHVEAVASVVGRAELLAALASTMLLLLVTSEHPPTARTRMLAALLAAAALASKEGGVVAPFLVLVAAWMRPEQRTHAVQWTVSALIGTIALLLARYIVLGTLGGDDAHTLFQTVSTGSRLTIALSLLPRAATMLFLPVTPTIDYAPTVSAAAHPDLFMAALGVLLVALAVAALIRHARRPTVWTLGMCIIAATMAPTANLFFASGVLLAGRNLYSPSIGAGLLVGAAVAGLLRTRVRRLVPYGVAVAAAAALLVTWREVPVWRSTRDVFVATAEREPLNYRVPTYWAHTALAAGQDAEALEHFRAAAALFPADWEMLTDGATVALRLGDTTSAIAWMRAAVDVHPGSARARTRLAAVLRARGDTSASMKLLRDGLAIEPSQRRWASMLESPPR